MAAAIEDTMPYTAGGLDPGIKAYLGSGGGGTSAAPAYSPSAQTPPPAAPTPAAPAGSITTFAGYTPDYAGLITSDPAYLAAQNNAQASAATAAAARKAALQQAVIRYGGVPSGFTDQYGDIDAATQAAANNNQFSTIAGLKNNYQTSVRQFMQQLAARGALQSGDLNYGQDQLDQAYGQQQYDATNALTDAETGTLGTYTGVLNTNSQNLAQAVDQAEQNVYANPAYRPQPASYANYDAASSAQYGVPIYNDGTGVLYNADGSVYTPGSGASAAPAAPGSPAPNQNQGVYNYAAPSRAS